MNVSPSPWTVVAGGSGGLGRAIAGCLASDGHDVIVTYRTSPDRARSTAEEIRERGSRAHIEQVDFADRDSARSFHERVTALGPVAGVVYAAGPPLPMQFIAKTSMETFSEVIDADLKACFNLVQPFLPNLRETKGAIAGVVTPVLERYSRMDLMSVAPKAGIQALLRGVAAEEGRYGVRANAVGVGVIEGEGIAARHMASGVFTQKGIAQAIEETALRRFGQPVDIGEAVCFLMSGRARWITGQTLHVDGGFSL